MTDIPDNVDLQFIARQLQRQALDIASLKDDLNVLTSIVLRQDNTLSGVLNEIRAVHTQIQRISQRLRQVEETGQS